MLPANKTIEARKPYGPAKFSGHREELFAIGHHAK